MMTARVATDLVSRFLRLLEERDLAAASRHLAPGVSITFPGGRRFQDLETQVASSAARFRSVRKVFDGFDVLVQDDGAVVYVLGTLEGEDIDGSAFAGVRFIDRFVLSDGLIIDHQVWNDVAETGVVRPAWARRE